MRPSSNAPHSSRKAARGFSSDRMPRVSWARSACSTRSCRRPSGLKRSGCSTARRDAASPPSPSAIGPRGVMARPISRFTAPVSLTSGFDVSGIDVSGIEVQDEVTVANIDGTMLEGASLIGADGLWSTVRKTIAPEAALRFSGATAYRALLPLEGLPDPFGAPVVGLWLGPRAHLVHYPVRGGAALNVVAVIDGGHESQGWNQVADMSALGSGFTCWCKESKSLIERAPSWRSWSLFSLAPLPRWSRGPITLLGDAAHPVLPYLAQGAALAIEDAAQLAQCITRSPEDPATAFRAYEAARRARATRLQHTSARFGRIYHLSGPARFARNLALRARSGERALRQFDWLYGEA